MIAEGDLVGCIGPVGQPVENVRTASTTHSTESSRHWAPIT